ncbi:MAG: hypothetical protein ACK5CA_14165 [Cyanobacteriota bacterium]|jgi:hypothetical protein
MPVLKFLVTSVATAGIKLVNSLMDARSAEQNRSWQEQENSKHREHAEELQIAQMKLAILQQDRAFEFQGQMADLSHERALEMEAFRAKVNWAIADRNFNFQKWQLEQARQLQYEILQRRQDFQLQVISSQRQNALDILRERLRSDRSPITTLAVDLLESSFDHEELPLKVLISPPTVDFDSHTSQANQAGWEAFLAEEIFQSLSPEYWHNPQRPVRLLDKVWESKKQGGGAALESLYAQLKAIPILVLESETIGGDQLNFRLGYWPGGNVPYIRQTLLSGCPVSELLAESAKQTALAWRPTLAILEEMGETEADIQRVGGVKYDNLRLYDAEADKRRRYEERGLDYQALNLGQSFQVSDEDKKNFYRFLAVWHCLVIATYADLLFFRRSWENTPLLPSLLPHLLARHQNNPLLPPEFWQEQIPRLIRQYDQLYGELAPELHLLKPDLRLRLAASVLALPQEYHYLALDIGAEAVADWLTANGVPQDKVFNVNNDEDSALLKGLIYQEDETFLTALASLMEGLNGVPSLDLQKVLQISSLLVAWQFLRRWELISALPQPKSQEPSAPQKASSTKPKTDSVVVKINATLGRVINYED